MLTRESKPHAFHVLLIHQGLIPSVRLCGHCQMEYLADKGLLEYRSRQLMEVTDADLNWAAIVIIGRTDDPYSCKLAQHLKAAGKYLFYILDDDLLNVPIELGSGKHYALPQRKKNILDLIALSDGVISPSPLLLKKYPSGPYSFQIEEPALDPVEYQPHDQEKPVKIGFAGSIDRTQDVETILRDVLYRIKQEYGDRVQFAFFGSIPCFAQKLNAVSIPYQDSYESYRRTLNELEWDIGLAPMPETEFHSCKHYNKLCEYAASGIVGVFSDVPPYTRARHLSEGGLFCENTAESWYLAIKHLLDDPQDREKRRRRMTEYARNELSLDTSAAVFLKVFGALPPKAETKNLRMIVARYRLYYCVTKVYYALKTHKFGIFKKIREHLFSSKS